jgi:hypothetical protein
MWDSALFINYGSGGADTRGTNPSGGNYEVR